MSLSISLLSLSLYISPHCYSSISSTLAVCPQPCLTILFNLVLSFSLLSISKPFPRLPSFFLHHQPSISTSSSLLFSFTPHFTLFFLSYICLLFMASIMSLSFSLSLPISLPSSLSLSLSLSPYFSPLLSLSPYFSLSFLLSVPAFNLVAGTRCLDPVLLGLPLKLDVCLLSCTVNKQTLINKVKQVEDKKAEKGKQPLISP